MEGTGAAREVAPAYLALLESGELATRVEVAYRHLEDCDLRARYRHVNRRESIKGAVCRTGERAVVHSFGPHHGEEDPLRGWNGSGTIFFSSCNLRCHNINLVTASHVPAYRADENPPLERTITPEEYREAYALAEKHGLRRLDQPRLVPRLAG